MTRKRPFDRWVWRCGLVMLGLLRAGRQVTRLIKALERAVSVEGILSDVEIERLRCTR
jgi:hypothetical protein